MTKKYALGLYEKALPADLTWEEKFQTAQEAGYDYMEISIDETENKLARLEMTDAACVAFVQQMQQTGLPIRSMCLSGHRKYPLGSEDPATAKRSLEIMQKAVSLAEQLGIRTIQLAGYDVYYEKSTEETRKRFAENLAKSVEMAERAGVLLGFETMETEFMNTVSKAMKYVDLMSSSYLGVYPDIGNITNAALTYHTDVLDDLRSGKGHLIALHLKETVPGKFREIPYGTGHVNFDNAIRTAWSLGVRRYVTEFWYTGSPSWKEDLQDAHDRFTQLLSAY